MDNITFVKIEQADNSIQEHVIIDRGNGEFTSMPKAIYDEMIANQTNGTIA